MLNKILIEELPIVANCNEHNDSVAILKISDLVETFDTNDYIASCLYFNGDGKEHKKNYLLSQLYNFRYYRVGNKPTYIMPYE